MLVNFCSVLKKSKARRFAYKMTSADVTIRTNRLALIGLSRPDAQLNKDSVER